MLGINNPVKIAKAKTGEIMSLLKLQNTEIRINGEPVILTKETLVSTCNWFADNSLKQIAEASDPDTKCPVNDLDSFIEQMTAQAQQYKSANFVPSLTFWQRAYFLQSGESVAILY